MTQTSCRKARCASAGAAPLRLVLAAGMVWLAGGARGVSAQVAAAAPQGSSSSNTLQEVIVTAQLAKEPIVKVPETITAFTAKDLGDYNIQSFNDYLTKVPDVTFAYGSSGLGVTDTRSISIEGIQGANTTGVYIDDTPVPENIDPRVVDIQRIEVLKGPQGTLFGAASMGGNVRLITTQPDVTGNDGTYTVQAGGTSGSGSADYGGNGMYNIAVVPQKFALRLVGFYQHDAGFLTNTFPSPNGSGTDSIGNQGGDHVYGGSISARWSFTDNFDATLRFLDQETHYQGLPEAYAPLPEFLPIYNLHRTQDFQESAYNKYDLTSLDLRYHLNNLAFTSSTSFFYNNTAEFENGAEGTTEIIQQYYNVTLNDTLPMQYNLTSALNQFVEEDRVSGVLSDSFNFVAGVYFMKQEGGGGINSVLVPGLAASGLWPTDLLYNGPGHNTQSQEAVFGQGHYKFLKRFELTLGGRVYKLRQTSDQIADGFFNGGPTNTGVLHANQAGFSPKVALSYAATQNSNAYVSYATGFRPGGPDTPLPPFCIPSAGSLAYLATKTSYQSDKVDNYEVGYKAGFAGGSYLSASAYENFWKNMQESVVFPCGDGTTANTGEARIRGVDLEFDGPVPLVPNLSVRTGLGLLSAVITDPGASTLQSGERIFQVPKVNGTLGVVYSLPAFVGGHPYVSLDYSYVGSRLSHNNGGSVTTPLEEPSYSILNSQVGFDKDSWRFALYMKNLTDAKPNLGDVQQIAFPQSVPGPNGTLVPYLEAEVMPPFQMGIQISHDF
jgi:iron complex outermembrane recepter protein